MDSQDRMDPPYGCPGIYHKSVVMEQDYYRSKNSQNGRFQAGKVRRPDINKTKAWLKARPAAKDYSRPLEIRTGTNRKRQMNLFDPEGTRSEVMEPVTVDGRPAPSAPARPRPTRHRGPRTNERSVVGR